MHVTEESATVLWALSDKDIETLADQTSQQTRDL